MEEKIYPTHTPVNDAADALSPRAKEVLADIVDIYTATGQPVGSKNLVASKLVQLSPATIRNVMADLEKKGYLASPHTSAGRIPTEAGFRYYVNSVVQVGDLDTNMQKELEKQIGRGGDLNSVLERASKTLSDMTRCAGLVTSPKRDEDPLEHIEFLRLSGDRVLAVMVTQSGDIQNRVIHVPSQISETDLNTAAKQLRPVVEGQTLADARVAMMQKLTEQRNRVDNMMNEMLASAEIWGEPTVSDGALVVAGSNNLFQYPELVRDQLRALIHTFEEKRILMALMDEVQKGAGVQVFIGKDCPLEAARDCAMVTSTYGNKEKRVLGTIGVIGPMRMDYRKTIQLVDYTAQLLTRTVMRTGG